MKVLWITNILFPEARLLLTGAGDLKSSGGWMLGAAEALQKYCSVDLHVATVSAIVKKLEVFQGKNITYYILPYGRGNLIYNSEYEPFWKDIKKIVQPDIIHIYGTEFTHGLSYVKACGNKNVVISLQGLKSEIAKYYCAGISKSEILQNQTFRDLLKGNILLEQKKFFKSGKYEIEFLKSVRNVIGRTSWDKVHVRAINPHVCYYRCNEILRNEFYDGAMWNYDSCAKHSIFLSQAGYPIKGLHKVLLAMPLILHKYPDAVLRIAGVDITAFRTLSEKIRLCGYGNYIRHLIQKLELKNHISFIGSLNAMQMKEEYLKANIFICPSSIENSPNSLGEAQILGTPCIASFVGGVPDMMIGNEDNLYRFEDVEILAEKVCKIFASENHQVNMIQSASYRHNPKINSEQLLHIYQSIFES